MVAIMAICTLIRNISTIEIVTSEKLRTISSIWDVTKRRTMSTSEVLL